MSDVEDKSLAKQEPQSALIPIGSDPEQLIADVQKHLDILERVKGMLKVDVHYRIDRKGKKVMKRSGFALYSYIFKLAEDAEPIEQELTYETPKTYSFSARRNGKWITLTETTDFRGFRVKVKIIHTLSGRASWGVAGCTMEEYNIQSKMGDGRWYHDCLATAYTRAMNRAISNIIGSAEISAEEVNGQDQQRSVKVVDSMITQKEITVLKPSWNVKEAIEMQGWEDAVNVIKTFIDNMGLDVDSFDIQVDAIKVTAKPLVTYNEDTFKAANEILEAAGFEYVKSQKLWRFNCPEEGE